jgi:hypothetical protein
LARFAQFERFNAVIGFSEMMARRPYFGPEFLAYNSVANARVADLIVNIMKATY